MALPIYELSLQQAEQNEDVSALAITHNNNMTELIDYINQLKAHVATLSVGGSGSLTQVEFDVFLSAAKSEVVLLAGMSVGQTIDFNGYRLTKVGIHAPIGSKSAEFQIIDTNVTRNTNFRKAQYKILTYDGQEVFPLIKATLTSLTIVFANKIEIESTQVDSATDPNNKRIILL